MTVGPALGGAPLDRVLRALEGAGVPFEVDARPDGSAPAEIRIVVVVADAASMVPSRRRPLERNGVSVDLDAGTVYRDGRRLALTRREWELLTLLARSPGRIVPNEVLLRELWSGRGGLGALHATVHRLRRKLETDPPRPTWVVTVPGVGVRLEGAVHGADDGVEADTYRPPPGGPT